VELFKSSCQEEVKDEENSEGEENLDGKKPAKKRERKSK
jgi:hypothetical protein